MDSSKYVSMFEGTDDRGFSTSNLSSQLPGMIKIVQNLHDSEEKEWSFRQYKKRIGSPACKGSYYKKEKVMRITIDIKAPLQKTLCYLLDAPFGCRNLIDRNSTVPRIVEKVGPGAVVIYNEPRGGGCFGIVALRDIVGLATLSFPSKDSAILAFKTIEHSSIPLEKNVYRIHAPLLALHVQEEGDITHVEQYIAEMDIGGKIGKVGPGKAMGTGVHRMIALARVIPKMQDVSPPYLQYM